MPCTSERLIGVVLRALLQQRPRWTQLSKSSAAALGLAPRNAETPCLMGCFLQPAVLLQVAVSLGVSSSVPSLFLPQPKWPVLFLAQNRFMSARNLHGSVMSPQAQVWVMAK